uniref:Ig-like domain-containing protein n=1 Tax=Mola mola TaxID=94237 RepID=A0A3Q3X7T3_MOLML
MYVNIALFLFPTSLIISQCNPGTHLKIYVQAGEMVALRCPQYRGYNHGDARPFWKSHTKLLVEVTNSMSEWRQMGVVVLGRSLVILNASANHHGNYSCSLGNGSREYWFSLTVYGSRSREYEARTTYSLTCYTQESCTLTCPDANTPPVNTLNITSNGTVWHKVGESLPVAGFFWRVEEKDSGVYTCTRSYLYDDQIYNMTLTVAVDIQPKGKKHLSVILSPHENDVFHVDLGSTVVINCNAIMYSDFDEVFWLSGDSFVDTNDSLPVFYNYTRESTVEEIKMTASLVFKHVSVEDLSKEYTCKLETSSEPSSFVTITLTPKASSLLPSIPICIGIITSVIVVTTVFCVKLKKDIFRFLRDTPACYHNTSDGKSNDAVLMNYKRDTEAALNEHDRECLKSVLEDEAEAALDCIKLSRTVVLVPTPSDPCLNLTCWLPSVNPSWNSRLTRFFIKTEATVSASVSDALQLLSEAGDCVTWKGESAMSPSSFFWKQLCYYLPAPTNTIQHLIMLIHHHHH